MRAPSALNSAALAASDAPEPEDPDDRAADFAVRRALVELAPGQGGVVLGQALGERQRQREHVLGHRLCVGARVGGHRHRRARGARRARRRRRPTAAARAPRPRSARTPPVPRARARGSATAARRPSRAHPPASSDRGRTGTRPPPRPASVPEIASRSSAPARKVTTTRGRRALGAPATLRQPRGSRPPAALARTSPAASAPPRAARIAAWAAATRAIGTR